VRRALLAVVVIAAACRQGMADRPPRRALGSSPFFSDRSASRPQVAGTVARAPALAGAAVSLQRGRERYEIFCAPCHGRRGEGDGVIAAHGFPRPPSFFSPAMMALTPPDVVRTIAEGNGTMYSYADRVPEPDRWAIAAYIRSLQSERRP
jgi:mono/diheme cytochrome c family protein